MLSLENFSPFFIFLVMNIDLLNILDLFSVLFLKKLFLPKSLKVMLISSLNFFISFPFSEKAISKPFFWLSNAMCFSTTSAPQAMLAIATLLSIEWSDIPTLHLNFSLRQSWIICLQAECHSYQYSNFLSSWRTTDWTRTRTITRPICKVDIFC